MIEEEISPGPGRPKKNLTPNELEKLVSMGCTDEEIAAWFGVCVRTIERKRKEPEYAEIFDSARAVTRISLRRAQLQAALAGNTTMLVWLGKIMLGQKDNLSVTHVKPVSEWTLEELCDAIRQLGGDPDTLAERAGGGTGAAAAGEGGGAA